MKRYTKNKYPVVSVDAELVSKRKGEYYAIPGEVPFSNDLCELEFDVGNNHLVFEVSIFEYNVVEEGMVGLLVYQGYELISFGSWIKDVRDVK